MAHIPREIIIHIGLMLKTWNDIWSYTMVFRFLRKDINFARFARKKFEMFRCWHTFGVKWADDRCRHWDLFACGNSDDPYDCAEHWLVNHTWIDYNCDPSVGETSENQWCFLPYGKSYNNIEGVTSGEILDPWIIEIEIEGITKLPTSRQNMIKEIYDNEYIRLLHEKSKLLFTNSFEICQNHWFESEFEPIMWLVDGDYNSDSDF